jgi:hypothetical protein
MTVVLIGLYLSLAICAIIGLASIRFMEAGATRLRQRISPPAERMVDPPTLVRRPRRLVSVETGRQKDPSPAKRDVETYFEKGRWKNKVQGSSRAANVHDTRSAALKVGHEMARKRRVDHVIKREDGSIAEQKRYHIDQRSVAPERRQKRLSA